MRESGVCLVVMTAPPPLAPGRTLVVYINLEANPTNVGSHDADVALLDGNRPIATIDRTQIDWP